MRTFYIASFIKLPSKLNDFRNKFDNKATLIAPHATFVFPFQFDDDISKLDKHILKIASALEAFEFSCKSFSISSDNYIFIDFEEGKERINEIHNHLYTDILSTYLRRAIPFTPHITIGRITDESQKDSIVGQLKESFVEFSSNINSFVLAEIVNEQELRKVIKEYNLS